MHCFCYNLNWSSICVTAKFSYFMRNPLKTGWSASLPKGQSGRAASGRIPCRLQHRLLVYNKMQNSSVTPVFRHFALSDLNRHQFEHLPVCPISSSASEQISSWLSAWPLTSNSLSHLQKRVTVVAHERADAELKTIKRLSFQFNVVGRNLHSQTCVCVSVYIFSVCVCICAKTFFCVTMENPQLLLLGD